MTNFQDKVKTLSPDDIATLSPDAQALIAAMDEITSFTPTAIDHTTYITLPKNILKATTDWADRWTGWEYDNTALKVALADAPNEIHGLIIQYLDNNIKFEVEASIQKLPMTIQTVNADGSVFSPASRYVWA